MRNEVRTRIEAIARRLTRRDFLTFAAGGAAAASLSTPLIGHDAPWDLERVRSYPIDFRRATLTTADRVLSFPLPAKPAGPGSGKGLYPTELPQVTEYGKYGYGNYTFGGPLPIVQRFDLMPPGYAAPGRLRRLVHFFTISDIHITDKETPNQLIYMQQEDPVYGAPGLSLYSPVMLYTTQVLDAAIQTVNALHERRRFDFGISLGDACNSTQYNELRWFIDVLDGKVITPSSGAHVGAATVDYQRPFKAAGLNREIPWYQVLGNHDHFWLGSVPVDADPTLSIRAAYTSDEIWATGDLVRPNSGMFPCLFDWTASMAQKAFYMGVIDGSTRYGNIKGTGAFGSTNPPPTVTADWDRRHLLRTEWIEEFFHTTTHPVGHGLNLVDGSYGSGFACYSFVPKADIPLKIIVLDDTQSETDGSHDIHGHGFLDATRWNWLQRELADGQAENQLMIIAAHVPIAVANIGSEVEWWESGKDPHATLQNAVSLADLVATLRNTPNLLMWLAGHRHLNTVKAFPPTAEGGPESGFWQVETSALRDFPQQFRTFQIYLNSDYTVSIVTTNVDPAVAEGTPAATSRSYSIAAMQIIQGNRTPNSPNLAAYPGPAGPIPVEPMDPTRPQGTPTATESFTDPSIVYGSVPGVPCCASYNAELFKQLSPAMVAALRARFHAR